MPSISTENFFETTRKLDVSCGMAPEPGPVPGGFARRALAGLAASLEPPAAAGRIPSVEGTRAVAAAVVLLCHVAKMAGAQPHGGAVAGVLDWLWIGLGPLGTDCFLVISGCFVYRSLLQSQNSYLGFLRRRVLRTYPVFLVVLLVYVAYYLGSGQNSPLPRGALRAGMYILANLALLPGLLPIQPIVVVSWTLSYIFAFYLTCPLLVRTAKLGSLPRTGRVAILALLAVGGAGLAVADPMRARVSMFFVGMLVWEATEWFAIRERKPVWLPSLLLGVSAASLAAFCSLFPRKGLILHRGSGGFSEASGVLIAGVTLFCFCACAFGAHAGLSRLLSGRLLRTMGWMSYSLFLTHMLAVSVFLRVSAYALAHPAFPLAGWFRDLATIATSMVLTTVFFLLIERPFILRLASPAGSRR